MTESRTQPPASSADLIARARAGERRALALVISELERLSAASPELLSSLQPDLWQTRSLVLTGPPGAAPVTRTADGNNVAFAATVAGPMGQMELKFTGTLDGDSISGNVAFGSFGSGTFTGSKA